MARFIPQNVQAASLLPSSGILDEFAEQRVARPVAWMLTFADDEAGGDVQPVLDGCGTFQHLPALLPRDGYHSLATGPTTSPATWETASLHANGRALQYVRACPDHVAPDLHCNFRSSIESREWLDIQ
ncbi:hypothetical protein PCL_09536 [Purpureocillium lilacinum]|uniref:Uncharacterized protein n=1 Tax=Purpureocillium lilacinum TaxID=33203 RepID=A0A2U3DQP6_PURLI|nr:hypothetical protein PCL_09536 [Purpureocillium lilacinum]